MPNYDLNLKRDHLLSTYFSVVSTIKHVYNCQDEVPDEPTVKFKLPPPTRSSYCSDVLAYDGGMEIPKLENLNHIKKSGC